MNETDEKTKTTVGVSTQSSDAQASHSCSDSNSPIEPTPAYVKYHSICRTLDYYLEKEDAASMEKFSIPDKFLPRFWVMDIVNSQSRNSCCFTKRYVCLIEI